jgi:uncharacterized protein (UPF0333 family)
MSIFIKKKNRINYAWSLLICGLVIFLCTTLPTHAESVVSSSISVSANSGDANGNTSNNSKSTANVKVIINDEVVEDWSQTSTGTVSYQRTIIESDSDLKTEENLMINEREADYRSELLAIIKRLQAIIALYVTLIQN